MLFALCSTKPKYHLTGTFSGEQESVYNGKMVYLLADSDGAKLDSCIVSNNRFQFSEAVHTQGELGFVDYDRERTSLMFVKELGDIELKISDGKRRIGGTPQNDSYQQFVDSLEVQMTQSRKYIDELEALNDAGKLTKEVFGEKEAEKEANLDMLENYVVDYISKQSGSPLAYYVYSNDAYFLGVAKQKKLINALFKGNVTDLQKKQLERLEAAESIAEGKKYKDIVGLNVYGDSTALSNFVGKNKLVLVDFWASWCGPCRSLTPSLQSLQTRYKSKGLAIVGVTVDEDRGAWIEATRKDKMTWAQISAGTPNEPAEIYALSGIPYLVLIDDQGIIRANGHIDMLTLEMKIRAILEE